MRFYLVDFHRSLPDSQLFLDSGIDVMNLPEFLKAFVGKSVEHSALVTSGSCLPYNKYSYL